MGNKKPPDEQQEPNNLEKLTAEVAALGQELNLRRVEKAEVEKRIRVAVQSGDVAARSSLQQHVAELELAIKEVEHRALRLSLRQREAELPKALAEYERVTQDRADRDAKLTEARTAFEKANFAFMDADSRVRMLRYNIADAKLEIAKQDAQQAKELLPPVVPETPFGWRHV